MKRFLLYVLAVVSIGGCSQQSPGDLEITPEPGAIVDVTLRGNYLLP